MQDNVQLLTYSDIATAFGITRESARRLVTRKRWPRRKGNDGTARIEVPAEALTRTAPANSPGHDMGYSPADSPGAVLERHIERLERELQAVTTERDAMLARVIDRDSLAARVEMLNSLLEAEKQRADGLRGEHARLLEQLTEERSERSRLIAHINAAQDRHAAELTAVHERMARTEHDRDQALERLNHNIDRLDRVQAEHRTEIAAVRDQLTQAESNRNRAVEALAAHLALPWWRRMFS